MKTVMMTSIIGLLLLAMGCAGTGDTKKSTVSDAGTGTADAAPAGAAGTAATDATADDILQDEDPEAEEDAYERGRTEGRLEQRPPPPPPR